MSDEEEKPPEVPAATDGRHKYDEPLDLPPLPEPDDPNGDARRLVTGEAPIYIPPPERKRDVEQHSFSPAAVSIVDRIEKKEREKRLAREGNGKSRTRRGRIRPVEPEAQAQAGESEVESPKRRGRGKGRGGFEPPSNCLRCGAELGNELEIEAFRILTEVGNEFNSNVKAEKPEARQQAFSRMSEAVASNMATLVCSRVVSLDAIMKQLVSIHTMLGAPKLPDGGDAAVNPLDKLSAWMNSDEPDELAIGDDNGN